jgi:formamidopyrimidine-DNA glycosylase
VPEVLEAEMYRCALTHLEGRVITAVGHTDALVVPDSPSLIAALTGAAVTGVRRHGKVVLIDTDRITVGVHFAMTGRIVVGDHEPISRLAYGPGTQDQRFDRWVFDAEGPPAQGALRVRLSDPRRLARVTLDPDLTHLGPDAMAVDAPAFARLVGRRRSPIKAVLLDQHVLAGLGNLLADELLWRGGVAPHRLVDDLTDGERSHLGELLPMMLVELMARGGSHRGDLAVELRRPGARCPRDGAELVRRNIAGRTSWSCPLHQR